MSDQYKRDDCYFCDEDDEGILQTHHIVPQRFDGPDTESNLVTVCPTCHRKIESLYDKRFYSHFQMPVEESDGATSDDPDELHGFEDTMGEYEAKIYYIVAELQESSEVGASLDCIIDRAADEGIYHGVVEYYLERFCSQGEVYEPQSDKFRVVR